MTFAGLANKRRRLHARSRHPRPLPQGEREDGYGAVVGAVVRRVAAGLVEDGFVAAGFVTGSDGMAVFTSSAPPLSRSPVRTTSAMIVSIARWSWRSVGCAACVVAGMVAERVVAFGTGRLNSS